MVRGRPRTVRRHRPPAELRAAIDRAVDAGDAGLVRRLCFVGNCYAGESAAEAARRVGVSAATGARWIDRWNENGVDGLRERSGGGRPSKLEPAARDRLRALVAADGPMTTAAIQDRLETEFDVSYASAYLPRLLRSIGLQAVRHAAEPTSPGRPPLSWTVPESSDGETT